MTPVFSGGLVYEFTQETSKYGLVQISDNGTSAEKLVDYDNLKKMYEATAAPTGNGGFQENLPAEKCPAQTSLWEASNTLPDLPSSASGYMVCLTSLPAFIFCIILTLDTEIWRRNTKGN